MNARPIASGIVLATMFVTTALLFKYAQIHHLIRGEAATRGVQVMLGLVLAAYGNAIPKGSSACGDVWSRRKQQLLRFGGWAFALAGLGYAAIWCFVPADRAGDAAMALVAAATAATLVVTLWTLAARLRSPGNPAR